MFQASASEVQADFRRVRERAEGGEPILVRDGEAPPVVILSEGEYARLKRRDKRVVRTEDLPNWIVERIASAEMGPDFAHLDEGL